MATNTTNYSLTKPALTDNIDVTVLNANFDTIDREMKKNYNMASSVAASTPARATVNLTTTWDGEGPYTQTVTIDDTSIDENSKIDLQPNATVLNQLIDDEVQALWIVNNNGTLTAYALGAYPTVALSIQCTVASTKTSLSSIAITTQPTKTTYAVGNTMDLTGLVVTATYADGSTADVTDDCVSSIADGETITSEGSQSVTVSYTYMGTTEEAAFLITVNSAIASLSVTTVPTTITYIQGDALDLTGLVITGTYTDGSTADVTSGCTFSPADGSTLSTGGTQAVTVTYTESDITKTTSFNVTVDDSALTSLTVTTQPTTTTYVVGDALDLTGLEITASFASGLTMDVTEDCGFSPANGDSLDTAGTQTVSVAYASGGVTMATSFTVTVTSS